MHRSFKAEDIIKERYGIDLDEPGTELICSTHGEGIIVYVNGETKESRFHLLHLEGINYGDLCIFEEHSAIWDIIKNIKLQQLWKIKKLKNFLNTCW